MRWVFSKRLFFTINPSFFESSVQCAIQQKRLKPIFWYLETRGLLVDNGLLHIFFKFERINKFLPISLKVLEIIQEELIFMGFEKVFDSISTCLHSCANWGNLAVLQTCANWSWRGMLMQRFWDVLFFVSCFKCICKVINGTKCLVMLWRAVYGICA